MKREEMDNLFVDFDEMGFCPTTLCKDAEEYAIEWRNNMRNAIAKHETDLLKELVAWLKGVYAKDYDDKGKIADKSIGRGDKENYWYMVGQQIALQRIIDLLDNDLEKFLETKNEKSTKRID